MQLQLWGPTTAGSSLFWVNIQFQEAEVAFITVKWYEW
jgi:hypothetical protein